VHIVLVCIGVHFSEPKRLHICGNGIGQVQYLPCTSYSVVVLRTPAVVYLFHVRKRETRVSKVAIVDRIAGEPALSIQIVYTVYICSVVVPRLLYLVGSHSESGYECQHSKGHTKGTQREIFDHRSWLLQ